jgi:glyoxylase-like metal-dependent hydrolase (beta-lactamase superfamily II)
MFNVGEGECILVVFPNERAWIIDCGSGNSTGGDNQKLGAGVGAYLLERGLKLEALIPSHPHIDHAGGYRSLLEAGPLLAPKVLMRGNIAPVLALRGDGSLVTGRDPWRRCSSSAGSCSAFCSW